MTWLVIALKDLRVLTRDGMGLFWVLGFPILFAAFFGSVMRAGVEADTAAIAVVVVDVADSPYPDQLVTGLKDAGVQTRLQSLTAARRTVQQGQALAYLHIRPPRADDQPLHIELGVDPARRAEAAVLENLTLRLIAPAVLPPGTQLPEIHAAPIADNGPSAGPRNGFEIVFPAMIMWGLMGCAATFAVALVSEAGNGTLLRLRAAPIHRTTILAGKGAACMAACVFDASLLALLGRTVLGVRIEDGLKFSAALAAVVLCFAGLTMVLSVLGRTEQSVAGAGWSTLIVFAMLGGAMVPLSVMPPWLQDASDLSPVKWGIVALEGATWRSFSWPELYRYLTFLVGLGVLGFVAGASVFSMRRL